MSTEPAAGWYQNFFLLPVPHTDSLNCLCLTTQGREVAEKHAPKRIPIFHISNDSQVCPHISITYDVWDQWQGVGNCSVFLMMHNCRSVIHRFQFWCTVLRSVHHVDTHVSIFKVIKIINNHLAHQRNQISKVLNAKLCSPNTFLLAMLIGLNVTSSSCILKLTGKKKSLPFYAVISFRCLCFHFSWKHVAFTRLTCAKVRSAVRSDNNIVIERESIKAVEKDLSATVVTSIHSTGATVVNSVKGQVQGEGWFLRRFPLKLAENVDVGETVIWGL